jgi:hypothetical protein
MFVQCIRARVRDREALERARDRWETELAPAAIGFVGSTGGITPTGEVVLLARFESAAAAAENGNRPEQDAWWSEMVATLDGEPTVRDTEDVDVVFDHGCDEAGFVQIMTGSGDPTRLKDLNARFAAEASQLRPDLVGGYSCFFADGTFADVSYFTSEADARAAESQEMPEAVQALFGELGGAVSDLEYHDLGEPWIV